MNTLLSNFFPLLHKCKKKNTENNLHFAENGAIISLNRFKKEDEK